MIRSVWQWREGLGDREKRDWSLGAAGQGLGARLRLLWTQQPSTEHVESPKPAVPTTGPLGLLRVSEQAQPPSCFFRCTASAATLRSASPRLPGLLRNSLSFQNHREASDADTPRGSDFLSFNSWIHHPFPETLPCTAP